jgi:hypothetical protein
MTVNTNSRIVRGYLNNLSLSYGNSDQSFVGDKIFPMIDGINRQAQVFKYVKSDQFRIEVERRGRGGTFPVREVRGTTVSIDPVNWALRSDVTDEERLDARAPGNYNYNPEEDAVEDLGHQFMMKREQLMSEALYATTWGASPLGGEDAGGNWGNTTIASDTFIEDVEDRKATIISNTGQAPNRLMLTYPAWQKIAKSPKWNDKVTTNQQLVTPAIVGDQLNLQIIVGWAIDNQAAEGVNTENFSSKYTMSSSVADNVKGQAFLYYAPETPGRKKLSVGYQYRIRKEESGTGILIKSRRAEEVRSDAFEGEMELDYAPMATDCGFLWKNTASV